MGQGSRLNWPAHSKDNCLSSNHATIIVVDEASVGNPFVFPLHSQSDRSDGWVNKILLPGFDHGDRY